MKIASPTNTFEVGKLVGEVAGKYRLYLCRQASTNRKCLLQIATDLAQSGTLDRAAFLLRELKQKSDELEEEYAKVREDPKNQLKIRV